MCEYIKDDGDQCGIDSHEGAFCHLHEDSEQAERYESGEPLNDEVREKMAEGYQERAEDADDALTRFPSGDDPGICGDCEEPVRRAVASVSEAKFKPKRVAVEEEFRCGCGSVTIGTKEYPKSDVPDGWY